MYIESHRAQIFGICRRTRLSRPMALDFISFLSKIEATRGIKSVVDVLKGRYHSIIEGEIGSFKTHSDGTWVGPFRPISRVAKRGRLGRRRALRLLRCYGLFVHKAAVKGDYQREKARLSKEPEPKKAFRLPLVPRFTSAFNGIKSNILSDTYPLTTKRAPFIKGKIPEILMSPAEHISFTDAYPNFMLEFYERMADLIGPNIPSVEHYQSLAVNHTDMAGSVALLTKDRGLKLRLIANTNRVLQLAISPLHNFLFSFLEVHPSSFCFDQDAGGVWVAEQLGLGHRITSMDLDSASDNIPLLPQLDLVMELCPSLETELRMFHRAARMRWLTPYPDVEIRWLRGHPMGVVASFPLFTTWLCSIFEYSGLTGKYAIVGDDLVFHSEYERKVRGLLDLYRVPISFGKSLFDNEFIAEFVGRIIDSHGSLEVYKASGYTREDPTGLIRQYGEGSLDVFNPVKRFRVTTKNIIKLGHLYASDPIFRQACIDFASPRDKVFLSGLKPAPLNLGGVSDTIIDKMVGNLLLTKLLDEEGEKIVRYALLRIFDNGRLYSMLVGEPTRATNVHKFTVRSNSQAHAEHRKMLLDLLEKARTEDDVASVLSYVKYSPGIDVVDVAKAEHIAKQNRTDPSDIEKWKKTKVKRGFPYLSKLSRVIKRSAKNFLKLRIFLHREK